jgi:hypothetical protein
MIGSSREYVVTSKNSGRNIGLQMYDVGLDLGIACCRGLGLSRVFDRSGCLDFFTSIFPPRRSSAHNTRRIFQH